MKNETERLWYVRLAGQVRGPFPTAAITQDLAVGRLPANAELSSDRVEWAQPAALKAFSQLLRPDQSDAWAEERRQALRRWADERDGEERRVHDRQGGAPRAVVDRREGDGVQRTGRYRRLSDATAWRNWIVIGGLVVLLIGLVLLMLLLGPGTPEIKLLK